MTRKSLEEQNESINPKKLKHEVGSAQTENSVLNSKLITSCDVLLVECDKENEIQLIDYLKNFSSLHIQKKEEIMEIIFEKITRFVDKPVLKDKFCLEEECVYNLEDVNQHKLFAFISFFEKILVENSDQFLGEKRLKILFALLKCLDQKIRESVNSFLRNLFKIKEKELKEIYKDILRNEYISILNYQNEPVGLECLLELSLYVLVSNGFESFCELEIFFKECIFPILKFQNSTLYFNELKSLLRAFSVSDNSALPLILSKLINLFYCENTEKKSMAVNLASNIIKTKEIHLRYLEIENFLVQMINLCFKSDHIFLINAVYKFLSDESIFCLLKQNKSFLPKIFDSFYDLSYKHWNVRKSPEIPYILDLLMKIDPMGYFECAKLYKYNKYKECMEKQCLYDEDNDFDKIFFNEQIVGIRKKSKPFKK